MIGKGSGKKKGKKNGRMRNLNPIISILDLEGQKPLTTGQAA